MEEETSLLHVVLWFFFFETTAAAGRSYNRTCFVLSRTGEMLSIAGSLFRLE